MGGKNGCQLKNSFTRVSKKISQEFSISGSDIFCLHNLVVRISIRSTNENSEYEALEIDCPSWYLIYGRG